MLAIISMATFAQKEPGTLTFYPRVGVNFSTFSDGRIYHLDESYTESEFKPGLVIGAELEYQLNNLFAIGAGALYSQQGEQYDLPSGYAEYDKMKYETINIPLLAVFKTHFGLSVKGGLQPAVFKTHFGLSVKGGLQPEFTINNPDFKAKKVNLSLPLGLSYEYKNLSLDLRYNLGLTNVWDYVNSTEKNRTIMITLGYGVEL